LLAQEGFGDESWAFDCCAVSVMPTLTPSRLENGPKCGAAL
jgi:hypothetical protein